MKLRPATPADLGTLRLWDEKPHVIAASGEDAGLFDWEHELARRPDWRELLMADVDGRAVGFIQIIDPREEETHYWGDVEPGLRAIDIWIGDEADLGRGYGTQMMHRALARCFEQAAVHGVLVDPLAANRRAHRFYERLGFVCVDRRMFGADDCRVFRLPRETWERRGGP
jgi:aminoglycoside 6'-N-acetyltransferase